jgi:hypothetical protein
LDGHGTILAQEMTGHVDIEEASGVAQLLDNGCRAVSETVLFVSFLLGRSQNMMGASILVSGCNGLFWTLFHSMQGSLVSAKRDCTNSRFQGISGHFAKDSG